MRYIRVWGEIRMSGGKRTVFISCGQFSESEKALGRRVAELVRKLTPFEGYFAENQTSLEGLTQSILGKLFDSVGFIAVMHHRGRVETPNGTLTRASVWIEQEVAIAALMQQVGGRPLHVASYIGEGIALEGVRQHIHLNPEPFRTDEDVIEHLSRILPTWRSPLYLEPSDRKRQVEGIKLTLGVIFGHHPNFTIELTNHSKLEIFVDYITLWYGDKKLCEPSAPEGDGPRSVPGGAVRSPIAFKTSHDPVSRLENYSAIERHLTNFMPSRRVDIKIEIEFEVLGERCSRTETVTVDVDHNQQIRPIPE
jgi:hypothetical protein